MNSQQESQPQPLLIYPINPQFVHQEFVTNHPIPLQNQSVINNTQPHFANDALDSKRHRRSKHEQEGRIFQCEKCGKSYLSQPAVNSHKKTKHPELTNGERRGRGRPRKNPSISAGDFETNKYDNFFTSESFRTNKENETIDVAECISIVFNSLYKGEYKDKLFTRLESTEDSMLFTMLLKEEELP